MRGALAFAAFALVGTSCARMSGQHPAPPAVREDHIRAPHGTHARAKVECIACHEGVYDAAELDAAGTLPAEAKCLECHGERKEKGDCAFCHTDVSHATARTRHVPEAPLRMSHARHIDLVKEDCTRCHKSLPEPFASEKTVPKMADCLSCHEHGRQYAQAKCQGCHPSLNRFALRPVSDFSHQGDYRKGHAADARGASETCAQCHDQTFCADCHARTVTTAADLKFPERLGTQYIHPGDFVGRHAVEAAADSAACRRCHGQSFCDSCHQSENLTPAAANPRDPHPAGWSMPGSPRFHGEEARRDVTACAACHDQGPRSNCIGCHRVGGIGGNPHPPSWLSHHNQDEIRRNSMCGWCHL